MLDLRQSAQTRPVNWRWQRASLVRPGERQHRFRTDKRLREAVSFQDHLRARPTDEEKMYLADKYPDMFEAWFMATREQSTLWRWEVEARLSAREAPESIAAKVGITVGGLVYFEAWFFNVLDRLDSPSYVLHRVLGESVQKGLTEREYDLLWKLYGYHGGEHVLDALIYKWENPTRPDDPNRVGAFFADDFRTQLRQRAALGIRTARLWDHLETITEAWMRWQEMEKASGGGAGGGTQEAILANMGEFLNQLPWEFDDTKLDDNPIIRRFDQAGIGLRSSELLLIGTGTPPAGLEGVIDQFSQITEHAS